MWYVRDLDNNFAILFKTPHYDETRGWVAAHEPKPGCGYETIWIENDRQYDELRAERDKLYHYVNGLIGLTQMIRGRDDVPSEVKDVLNTNHRVCDAAAYLTQIIQPLEK